MIMISLASFVLPNIFPIQTYLSTPKAQAATGVPKIFSYQGHLTDSSGNLLGGAGTSYYFKFSIWDSATVGSGTRLWPTSAPGAVTSQVTQGVFNVNIGDTANGFPDALTYDFNSSDTSYLQVEVSSDNVTFETLAPRQQITSSGYAINAATVAGKTPGTGANNVLTLDNSGNINIDGAITSAAGIQGGSSLTSGTALLINTGSGYAGNLVDLKVNNSSKLSVSDAGNLTLAGNITGTDALTVSSGGTGALTLQSSDQSASSTNSANIVIQTGNAAGATSNSGNVSVDAGTATGTAGTVNIGTSNASGVTVGRSGTNVKIKSGTPATNAVAYSADSNGTIAYTPQGGVGSLCLVSTDGGAPAFSSCSGSASTVWSSLSSPTQNLALSMGNFTTTVTFGAATGANTNLFSLIDTSGNTGTGYVLSAETVGGGSPSSAKPFRVVARGTTILDTTNSGAVNISSQGASTYSTTSGDITIQAGSGTVSLGSSSTLTNTGALTIASGGSGNLILDSASGTITSNGTTVTLGGSATINGGTAASGTLTLVSTTNATKGDIQFFSASNKITSAGALTIAGALSASNFSGTSSGTNTGDQTITLTGDVSGSGTGSFATTIQTDAVALGTDTTGNYVATITNGNGISGSSSSEGGTPTIALGNLTADWSQSGAFNIVLNNSSSGLKILENGATPSLYGIFDVADLSTGDKTYTFPNASGTVITTGNLTDIAGLTDSQISDTLTASNFVGSGSTSNAVDLGTTEVAGTLGISNGGTNNTSYTNNKFLIYNSGTGKIESSSFDSASFLTVESDTLATVTGRGNSTTAGIQLTENGNTSTSYGLYVKRNTDTSSTGYLIQGQNAAANTNLFTVDTAGNVVAGTFNTASISGGSLSSTAVNGVTTANIVVTTGSYADPSWITSLAWSKIATTPTTLGGYGITDALSNSSTSVQDAHFGDIYLKDDTTPSHYLQITDAENLTGTHILNLSVSNTDRSLTIAGDATISGTNTGDATVSGENFVTLAGQALTIHPVDLSGTNATGTLAAGRFPALTGDITTTAGSVATTLATVNANTGLFGSSTSIPSFTVNAKGLITAASGNAVVAPAGTLTGTTLNSSVVTSSLTSVGTLTGLTVTSTGTTGNQIAFTDTSLTTGTLQNISFTNNSAASAGNTATGLSITENAATNTGNTSNLLSLSAAAGGTVNGINISSATGFTNFLKTPSIVIDSTGAITGAPSISATTFTGALTGNASTATALQTPRTINGVSFDGTSNITVTAAAGTLTGTTLNSSVVTSSLTSVGTLGSLTVSGAISGATSTNTINNLVINGSTQTLSANNIADSGALTIASGTASDLTLNSGTTGQILIGSDASAENIKIGATSSGDKTITIGGSSTNTGITLAKGTAGFFTLQSGGAAVSCAGNANSGKLTADASGHILCADDIAGGGGSTLQSAYAAGNTISTSGNPIAFTLNSADKFTVGTAAGGTGDVEITLADGANPTPASQLLLVKNNDINQVVASGISVQSAAGGITTALDASGANLTNALSVGTNTILGSGSFSINLNNVADDTLTVTNSDGTHVANLSVEGAITASNFSGSSSGTNTGDQTNITGNAGTVTFADAGGDTTTFVALGTSATGSLAPATDAGLTYNATTDALTAATFIGALSGNASTATALQTARNINGVSFNGSADITVTAAAGTLTGTTLNSSVVTSSLTSVGTLTGLTVTGTGTSGTTVAFTNTSFTADASKLQSLTVTDASAAVGATVVSGLDLTLANGTNTNNSNTVNGINFQAATNTNSNKINGINFTSATGFTNFIKTPTFVLDSSGNITMGDGTNIAVGSSTGTKIGTATSQKIGFFNAAPIVQPSGNALTALSNLGLVATPSLTVSDVSGAAASGANTDITSVLLNQTGLVVKGATSNALTIKPNETLTAARTLNIVTGDASRTLTFAGDATISGTNTGDQTNITGNAGTVTFADAGGDTTTFVALGTSATGSLAPATDAGLTYNATTDALTAATFVGALSGNASTATALQNARTIGGVSFDGTANITVASATGGFTVSGGSLSLADATTPALSLASGKTNTGNITINGKTSGAFILTTADATAQSLTFKASAQTVGAGTLNIPDLAGATKTVAYLESPTFTTPNIGSATGSVSGNAGTATALQNARTIGGVSFDGTANITVASATGGFAVSGGDLVVTRQSTTALAVGRQGSTSPALQVDSNSASSVTGLKITAAAAGGGLALTTVGGNTDENLTLSAKGAGTITLANGSTGDIQFFTSSNKLTSSGALTVATSVASPLFTNAGGLQITTTASNGNITFANNGSGDVVINPDADSNLQITATGIPAVDLVAITNSGQAVTTANVNGLSINYTGGAAAVEAAAQRIDLTQGSTAGGVWNGLRIVSNASGPTSQIAENSIKLEGPTSGTAGGIANAIEIKNSKFTAALNIEEASSGIVMNSPFGGLGRYENYVTCSEEFGAAAAPCNSAWTIETAGVTVADDNTTAPDGTTTADKLTDNATAGTRISQSVTAGNSQTWTFSVWIKNSNATGSFKIGLYDNSLAGANDTYQVTVASPATDNWQRYSVTHITAGSGVTSVVAAIDLNQGNGGTAIFAWGAQLEKQSSPGVYVKTIGSALAYGGSNGLVVDGNLNNSTASGFVYGTRFIDKVTSGTAGTHDGVFIRTQDNTALANTVKGLEVQAWSGNNTAGTNIGIDTYGKTFGLSATTDALAGGVASPAAVFAYLQNTSATNTGNALRAYTDKATGATLVSFYQENSAFTGTGLDMNFGNGTGSFASGNFISLKNAGVEKAHIDSSGNIYANLVNIGTEAVCHATATEGASNDQLTDCAASVLADYAEMYPVATGTSYGDIVSIGTKDVTTNDGLTIKQLVTSAKPYDNQAIGIVSDNHGDFSSTGYNVPDSENPMPVALNGRVPVKFSAENGTVQPGDYVTTSSVPGAAMKATQPGWVIGQVLANLTNGNVMVFVRAFYYDPTTTQDASGNVTTIRSGSSTLAATSTSTASLIDQKGSGDLLQLQSKEADKLLVKNNGELNLNVTPAGDADNLVVVKSNDAAVFSINAHGQATFAGNIFIKDDSFAGSIATDSTGSAQVMFTYDLGTGKPDVQLTVEGEAAAFAQIASWEKDTTGNYTGFNIKTFGTSGSPASVIVHYLVVGKEAGYDTAQLDKLVVVTADQTSADTSSTAPTDAPTAADTTTSTSASDSQTSDVTSNNSADPSTADTSAESTNLTNTTTTVDTSATDSVLTSSSVDSATTVSDNSQTQTPTTSVVDNIDPTASAVTAITSDSDTGLSVIQ